MTDNTSNASNHPSPSTTLDNQQAIASLLEGKCVRQIDWKPKEYLKHVNKTDIDPDTKELVTQKGVVFVNMLGMYIPLSQEEMQGCLNRNVNFELYDPDIDEYKDLLFELIDLRREPIIDDYKENISLNKLCALWSTLTDEQKNIINTECEYNKTNVLNEISHITPDIRYNRRKGDRV